MSHIHRTVPIYQEPSRWYSDPLYDSFYRDWGHHPSFSSHAVPHHGALQPFRESFREPVRESFREPTFRESFREPFRDTVRDHFRDLSVYQPPSTVSTVAGPLSRTFFNPERQLSTMDGEMQRMAGEMRKMFSDMQHLVPVDSNPETWRVKENYHLDNPIFQDRHSGKDMFRLQFDVRQFKPEEIYVKTIGNQLEIHAKHEEKSEGKSVHKEYHRQYTLPKDLSPEALVSKLNRDGVLSIEAPLPQRDGGRDRLIAIKHE